jgi:hypothetical protein
MIEPKENFKCDDIIVIDFLPCRCLAPAIEYYETGCSSLVQRCYRHCFKEVEIIRWGYKKLIEEEIICLKVMQC